MSLKLNSSGGGSITLQEPSTASNRTLTLPDNTGTVVSTASIGVISQAMMASGVAGNGPAFSAYLPTSQSGMGSGTYNKVQCSAEEFDTANCYDTTNYRFTPNVAGYYQVSAAVLVGGSVNTSTALSVIYKNGSIAKFGTIMRSGTATSNFLVPTVAIIYMNGTTDYIELYGYGEVSGTVSFSNGANVTYFQAALVRAV